MTMKCFNPLRRPRHALAEPITDLSTPEARGDYAEALAAKEADYQSRLALVDFSRPPSPPVVRRRGDGDPPPTFALARKAARPVPPRASGLPDLVD
ncbi:hypothetical protein L1606_04455 [Streptomyces spororaveus]|uniref:hypothetical protein n=1 Tax=Streptomyces spororaveus TaxID=284039 RepID=UPI00207AB965|nr:hypothetical protein [Streptomyces spororaveus]MCM9077346.1 hypothetical protein [Streptomyces spororaveus]